MTSGGGSAGVGGGAGGGDAFGGDDFVERAHVGEFEAGVGGEGVDFADFFEVDAAAERVGFATVFERQDHRFGHARERGARREGEVEVGAGFAHAFGAERTRHAHVAAFDHQYVGPLE